MDGRDMPPLKGDTVTGLRKDDSGPSTTTPPYPNNFPVEVPGEDALKESRKYSVQVGVGSAIGVPRIQAPDSDPIHPGNVRGSSGTLGGYVDIRADDTGEWTTCGMTNYHVVRDSLCMVRSVYQNAEGPPRSDGSSRIMAFAQGRHHAAEDADAHGFLHEAAAEAERTAPAIAPHVVLHCEKLDQLRCLRDDIINEGPPFEDPAGLGMLQAEIQHRFAFVADNKHVFGRPFMGSGVRCTPSGHILDWALIGAIPPARRGPNTIPPHSAWSQSYAAKHAPHPSACGAPLKHPPPSLRLHDMQPGEVLFKIGSKTGATAGIFQGAREACKLARAGEVCFRGAAPGKAGCSHRYTVTSCPGKAPPGMRAFALGGDSGAFVFNKRGEVVGMVAAGSAEEAPDINEVYIMDIRDAFEDIKALSKGAIADVRITES